MLFYATNIKFLFAFMRILIHNLLPLQKVFMSKAMPFATE